MVALVAICLAGLEELVARDLRERLSPSSPSLQVEVLFSSREAHNVAETALAFSDTHTDTQITTHTEKKSIFRGEAGCGKILLKNVSLSQASRTALRSLRSVQYLMVFVAHDTHAPRERESLAQYFSPLVKDVHWPELYAHWLRCIDEETLAHSPSLSVDRFRELLAKHDFTENDNNSNATHTDTHTEKETHTQKESAPLSPSFCARCIRDGTQAYGSMDAAKALGEAVHTHTHWPVRLTGMDLEVVAFVLNECITVGINLPSESKPFLSSKLPSEVRRPVINSTLSPSLRPSTAYLMVKLTQPRPGDILLDGLCGSGSVLVEAAHSLGCVSLGGDADKQLQSLFVEGRALLASVNNRAIAETALWSAHRLPLRNDSVDIAVMDIPFSKLGAVIPKHYRAKPPMFVEETARVLSTAGGRAVFLAQNHRQLISCLDSIYFRNTRCYPVNIGGYIGYIVSTERTEIAFRNQAVEIVTRDERGKESVNSKKRPFSFVNNLS